MSTARRRNPVPRRRRRDDEDGESSAAGDIDEFSMSEGSAISNVDDDGENEGSDASAEDENASVVAAMPVPPKEEEHTLQDIPKSANGAAKAQLFKSTPETEAMLLGLKAPGKGQQEVLSFDTAHESALNAQTAEATSIIGQAEPLEPQNQKIKRANPEPVKQKSSNSAFAPNRGGFFLHDDRGAGNHSQFSRSFQRGRGRGLNGGYGTSRYGEVVAEPADRQWAHDLHETVNKKDSTPPVKSTPTSTQIPTAKAAMIAPNRSFSISTVLGNVSVQVSMPGMENKKTIIVVKKQHTLLPQHRPPLRRDKPVRISIPEEYPRYIFPSMERSFIFIPRALRPNQQTYPRARGGRGAYQGSRRGSIFGGSVYSPSVAMSRKSSISTGQIGNGLQTPTDPAFRGVTYAQNMPRPVVRMPAGGYPMMFNQYPLQWPVTEGSYMPEHGTHGPAILHSPPVAIPMHQPRPQKTVSVAGIESPAFKAPQQQQEQPFHQQVPSGVDLVQIQSQSLLQNQSSDTTDTPLSHIPEGAIYAQPFQPYPVYPQSAYYGVPYAGVPMFFPPARNATGYVVPMGGPVMAPQFVPGPQQANYVASAETSDSGNQQSTVAHESNGMVFYYNKSQAPTEPQTQYQAPPLNGMMAIPPGPYSYPSMSNGMYYPPNGL